MKPAQYLVDICDSHFLDENGKLVKELRDAIFLKATINLGNTRYLSDITSKNNPLEIRTGSHLENMDDVGTLSPIKGEAMWEGHVLFDRKNVMILAFLVHMWKKMVNKVYIAEGGH